MMQIVKHCISLNGLILCLPERSYRNPGFSLQSTCFYLQDEPDDRCFFNSEEECNIFLAIVKNLFFNIWEDCYNFTNEYTQEFKSGKELDLKYTPVTISW